MYLFPSWRKNKYAFVKDNEDWWTVLVLDLFAIPATIIADRLSKHTRIITPNGISLTSFVIFFLGIVFLFVYPENNACATLCFILSCALDTVDGKLARLQGTASQFGGVVDQLFDMVKDGLGLMLVGFALNLKVGNPYPLIIILPYSLLLGVGHINHITRTVTHSHTPQEKKVPEGVDHITKWQLFCDRRGLNYAIYDQVEVIYVAILLIGINLQNPTLFLLVGIYIRSVFWIWRKCRKDAVITSTCPDKS